MNNEEKTYQKKRKQYDIKREEYYEQKKKEYEKKPQKELSYQQEKTKEKKEENQEKKELCIFLNEDEDEILRKMGLQHGFCSTKGKHVKGNITSYCKIKQTSKIFNILIKKRGTQKQPLLINLQK